MSEIKLPSEVIEQIDFVAPESTNPDLYYNRSRILRGAKIAATHYEQENKRLVEHIKAIIYDYEYAPLAFAKKCDKTFETYWLQYCRDNGIKGE